jgi:hypothetical protein
MKTTEEMINEKIKVYKLTINDGGTLYDHSAQNIIDVIQSEIEQMESDGMQIELSFEKMTVSEYNALPEFDGF